MASNLISSLVTTILSNRNKRQRKHMEEEEEPGCCIKVLEVVFVLFSTFMRFIGPLFFIALCLFVLLVASSFFSVILPFYHFSPYIKLGLGLLVCIILFLIFFNYLLAFLVKPGSVEELSNSNFYKDQNDPFIFSFFDLYEVFKNKYSNKIISTHPEYRRVNKEFNINPDIEMEDQIESTISTSNENKQEEDSQTLQIDENLEEENYFTIKRQQQRDNKIKKDLKDINTLLKEQPNLIQNLNRKKYIEESNKLSYIVPDDIMQLCKECNEYKPIRAHHCSICGYCVLKMDHHCAWINNCVGQNNLRYFILFLTWIHIGCLFILSTAIPMYFTGREIHFTSNKKKVEFNFVIVLSLAGAGILTIFNTWNWYLILRGLTTIEFWMSSVKLSKNRYTVINDFSLSWRKNFFLVFGTNSIFRALLFPSITKLPFSGLEWSKMLNYYVRFNKLHDFNSYTGLRSNDRNLI